MRTFNVISYDVWGNEEDGFEVNDLSKIGSFEVSEDATDIELLTAMTEAGFTPYGMILEWWDSGEGCEFTDDRNGKPLGRIQVR